MTPVSALRSMRQENCQIEDSLNYILTLRLVQITKGDSVLKKNNIAPYGWGCSSVVDSLACLRPGLHPQHDTCMRTTGNQQYLRQTGAQDVSIHKSVQTDKQTNKTKTKQKTIKSKGFS